MKITHWLFVSKSSNSKLSNCNSSSSSCSSINNNNNISNIHNHNHFHKINKINHQRTIKTMRLILERNTLLISEETDRYLSWCALHILLSACYLSFQYIYLIVIIFMSLFVLEKLRFFVAVFFVFILIISFRSKSNSNYYKKDSYQQFI